MAKHRCAILDDYQNVALKMADWSKVTNDLDIKVFNEHLGSDDNVVKALQGFPHRLRDARAHAVPERRDREAAGSQAPDHHRHGQSRHRRGGREGARHHGLRHRQLRQSDRRHRLGADARTDAPHRLREQPAQVRRAVADHARPRRRGHDARRHRARQARHPRRRDRQGLPHEGHRPGARTSRRSAPTRPASTMRRPRKTCSGSPTSSASTSRSRRNRAGCWAPRSSRC